MLPAHEAPLLTYPRMSDLPIGLLLDYHAMRLNGGLKRFATSWSSVLSGPPAASVLEMEEA